MKSLLTKINDAAAERRDPKRNLPVRIFTNVDALPTKIGIAHIVGKSVKTVRLILRSARPGEEEKNQVLFHYPTL